MSQYVSTLHCIVDSIYATLWYFIYKKLFKLFICFYFRNKLERHIIQYWDKTNFPEKITLWLRHIGKISYFHCSRLRRSRRCTDSGPWDTRPCRCSRRDSSVSCLPTPRPRSWLPERRRRRCTATRTNVRAPGNASPLSSPATDEEKTNCIYLEQKMKFIYLISYKCEPLEVIKLA